MSGNRARATDNHRPLKTPEPHSANTVWGIRRIGGGAWCENLRIPKKLNPRFPKVSVGFGRFSKVFEGFKRFSKVFEGFRRFPKVFEGFRRFSKVSEGFRRFPKVFEGF